MTCECIVGSRKGSLSKKLLDMHHSVIPPFVVLFSTCLERDIWVTFLSIISAVLISLKFLYFKSSYKTPLPTLPIAGKRSKTKLARNFLPPLKRIHSQDNHSSKFPAHTPKSHKSYLKPVLRLIHRSSNIPSGNLINSPVDYENKRHVPNRNLNLQHLTSTHRDRHPSSKPDKTLSLSKPSRPYHSFLTHNPSQAISVRSSTIPSHYTPSHTFTQYSPTS